MTRAELTARLRHTLRQFHDEMPELEELRGIAVRDGLIELANCANILVGMTTDPKGYQNAKDVVARVMDEGLTEEKFKVFLERLDLQGVRLVVPTVPVKQMIGAAFIPADNTVNGRKD